MHILVLGATGRNGQLIVNSALSRNHTVTALVRDPSKAVLQQHPNLHLVRGSPTSQSDIESALQSSSSAPINAVIFALGHRRLSGSPFSAPAPDCPHDLMETSAKALIAAIRACSTLPTQPKLIINSSQGVGESWNSMALPIKFIFSHATAMKMGLKDHERMDAVVRESGMPFVLGRPTVLKEGEPKPVRAWPDDGNGMPWMPSITRESLAEWLVDAVERDDWDGMSPVITN
ncbi:hypothetical protein BGZ63DRAFT_409064 [Mariannaea sp. PMI_226]|nr:hypothetical protein BGZ63DRAFT_409064 [Mariannaea sp. PMI_226]